MQDKILHPVDKLPITDTPVCTAWGYIVGDIGWYLPLSDAKNLELQARKAEAQLAVAVEFINSCRETYAEYEDIDNALAEIKTIGESEQWI